MSYSNLLATTITRWAAPVNNGFGDLSYDAPTTLLGRFQNDNENYIDEDGEEFRSAAIVYTTVQLNQNEWLFEGTSVAANPQTQTGAYKIRRLYTTQTPSGDLIVYKAILGGSGG